MTLELFDNFRDFILEKNEYFSKGYANAFSVPESEGIFSMDGDYIFPDDRNGNFFYLRNEPNVTFNPTRTESISDCGIGRLGFNDVQTIYLVAVVDGADEYSLVNNLRSTAMMFSEFSAVPTSAIWQKENVIVTEMQGFDEAVINKALTNTPDSTIVRLTLQITSTFMASNCIINPCKTC